MRDARESACSNGNGGSNECQQAKIDMQDCNQSCEVQYHSDRDDCDQNAHDCKDQCSLAATDTPTPEVNTPTDTPAPADTATNTPAPADTATNTPAPAATATNTPAPADTSTPTNTAAPADTATNTPAPPATSTNTPAPADTATNTPAPTATNTPAPAATATNTAVPPTATDTPLPAATATDTPVPATPTPTPTETPAGTTLVCTFAPGTQTVINAQGVSVSLPLTGHSTEVIGPADANGIRQITIPHGGTHVDCIKLPLNSGVACVRADPSTDSFGFIDCTGASGLTGYNVDASQDHNSNQDSNDPGYDGDTSCTATFTGPDGLVSPALLEDGTAAHPHTGVCNSPIHVTGSGTFPAGGTHLSERQILRQMAMPTSCSPNPCPPDGTPFDATAGDTHFNLLIGTGHATASIFDVNNDTTGATPTESGSIDGIAGSCAAIDAGDLSQGKVAGAFPGLDENVLGDSVVTFQILCCPPHGGPSGCPQ
jgi:hypothetical protein